MAGRLANMGQIKYMSVVSQKAGTGTIKYNKRAKYLPKWNGQIFCNKSALEIPLKRKNPTTYFVPSMGDLFHPGVPFEFIDKVMAVIALCPQHTFQVLTKRPERMLEYINWQSIEPDIIGRYNRGQKIDASGHRGSHICGFTNRQWPLKNLWLGTTVCNQKEADEKIPILLQIPAAKRFLSIEPMLGWVELWKSNRLKTHNFLKQNGLVEKETLCGAFGEQSQVSITIKTGKLDWVIVAAESGPGARFCPIENIRSVVEQGKEAGVPVFVKQIHLPKKSTKTISRPHTGSIDTDCEAWGFRVSKNMAEWPEDLRIQEMP